MATTYTTNYNLGKQENHADKFDMDVITDNADKIDAALTGLQSGIDGKQASLTTAQLAAVNSGIDSTKVDQITTNKNNVLLIKHAENTSLYFSEIEPAAPIIGDYWLSSANGVKVYGRTDNLFDTFDIIGQVPSTSSGELTRATGATCSPIGIDNGDITMTATGTGNTNTYLFLYDSNMTLIGYLIQQTPSSLYGKNIVGYENAAFCRIRINTENLENITIMLNTGDTAEPYAPYLQWQ